jgi:transcriptional regulator with XRE-family HTH domain
VLHLEWADRIATIVAEHPGITTADLRHRLRRTRRGVQRFDRLQVKALRYAIRSGVIFEVDVAVPDAEGRLRHRRACYPAGYPVPFQASMTGNELWSLRDRSGWTQADVAGMLHVSKTLVSQWERRYEDSIPTAWAVRILNLDPGLGDPNPAELARRQVIGVVRATPGVPLWRLLAMTDHTAVTRRAIDLLQREGGIAPGPAHDSLGRQYRGLYLRGSEPPPPRGFARDELRRLRKARGLSSTSLGALVGVRGNTITRWETESRSCPPDRVKALREILAS